jgi:uncharacterized protein (TIGR04222 family)
LIIPRPSFLPRFSPDTRTATLAIAVLAASLLLAGCQNVLDLRGPEFLGIYGIGMVAALVLSWAWGRWSGLRSPDTPPARPLRKPFEIAFLAGGPDRAFHTVIASAFGSGTIQCGRDTAGPWIKRTETAVPEDAEPETRQFLEALPPQTRVPLSASKAGLVSALEKTRADLVRLGYWLPPERKRGLRWRAALPLLCLMALGIAKAAVGISRDKPVFFLILLLVLTLALLFIRLATIPSRTTAGDGHLSTLKRTQKAPLRPQQAGAPSPEGPDPAMMVALGGVAFLALPGFDPLKQALQSPGATGDSSSCGGSSCGGSSCGSGCGGCGGGD